MREFNKTFFLKAAAEVAIVVIGVTIAFWVEQYRDKLNNKQHLESLLYDIEVSLKDDSLLIAQYSYEDINYAINNIDTSINLLLKHKTLNLGGQLTPVDKVLVEYNNATLNAFISSESFNGLGSTDLKRRMISYRGITTEMWHDEQGLLDYVQNQLMPTIHWIGDMYADSGSIVRPGPDVDRHLVKAVNDLRYLRKQYVDKKERLWPFVIEQNQELRKAITSELEMMK